MSIGMRQIRAIQQATELAESLGFQFTSTPIYTSTYGDVICLRPISDALPVFSRDAEIFTGDLNEVIKFLRGIEWARNYDSMIKLSNSTKRERKEQDVRNQSLANKLKE